VFECPVGICRTPTVTATIFMIIERPVVAQASRSGFVGLLALTAHRGVATIRWYPTDNLPFVVRFVESDWTVQRQLLEVARARNHHPKMPNKITPQVVMPQIAGSMSP
jgi:hypothetical protein